MINTYASLPAGLDDRNLSGAVRPDESFKATAAIESGSEGRRKPGRGAYVVAAVMALAAPALVGCGGTTGEDFGGVVTDSAPTVFSYTGATETYTVPAGVTRLTVVASGGAGGNGLEELTRAFSAQVTATVAVEPGQSLLVSVGQEGQNASHSDKDPHGGWGALGATGGNGNAAYDSLRSSGAGGGATVVQLTDSGGGNVRTIVVAGGGGGMGAVSGDPDEAGEGGFAGCTGSDNGVPLWSGLDGGNGSEGPLGAKGGTAASQPTMAGARGKGGSGLGGNGGGGGGGQNGGGPGAGAGGTFAGGGGGAGSSATFDVVAAVVACSRDDGNGKVVITP